jgi:predicted O-methyltransferase YrrM
MDNFERVRAQFDALAYMRHPQATLMRDLIIASDARDILEIGFYHGKSSAYFAAILEDLGRGHLVTIDRQSARNREPNIERVLSTLGLAHRVTPVFAERSYTWELGKMVRAMPRPQFDLCYFDGGHTWDGTGFGFVLVDMLLRPGGWIVFDDLKWTMEAAMRNGAKVPRHWRACSEDERAAPGVKLVFDLLVPHLGYTDTRTINGGWWGIARKPLDGAPNPAQPRASAFMRILHTLTRRAIARHRVFPRTRQ